VIRIIKSITNSILKMVQIIESLFRVYQECVKHIVLKEKTN